MLLISVLINLSALATYGYYRWYQNSSEKSKHRRSEFRKFLYKKLQLNDAQKVQMDTLHNRYVREIKPIYKKIRRLRGEMITVLRQDSVDLNLVQSKVDSIKEFEKKIEMASAKNLLRYKKILNSEQQEKFIDIIYGRYDRNKKEKKPDKKE